MTLSTTHRAIQPSLRPAYSPTHSITAKAPTESAKTLDTFERVATSSPRSVSASESPELARLLDQVKAEKSAQNTNPVFPSTPLEKLTEFPVIYEKLQAESQMNLQAGSKSGFMKSQIEPAKGVVLALHGWSAGTWQFEHMAEQLQEQGYHVYAPRLPGHGIVDENGKASSLQFPQNHQSHLYREYADETYAEVASLGLPVSIVGLSGGGAIGLDIAGRYPDIQSATLYDPFLSPANPAETLVNVAGFFDRFTFGLASYLLRMIPVIFTSARDNRDNWGRDGHVDFDGGMIFGLSTYGKQAVRDSKDSKVPMQIVSSEFENMVVSRSLIREVFQSNTESRGWHHYPTEAEVPHAMIHWREFGNDDSRADLRRLTMDFLNEQAVSDYNIPK